MYQILTPNNNEKAAIENRAKKMEVALKLCQEIYKSKYKSKIQMAVKPECLYATDIDMDRKRTTEIEKNDESICGISWDLTNEYALRLKPKRELHIKCENMSTATKER